MKFLLTKELGRLAKWLRILGFDTEYSYEHNTGSLLIQALRESRIIVTRNHRFPASRGVRIIVLESETIKEEVAEALKALNIRPVSDMMFTRCIICNDVLVPVEKEAIKNKVPEYVFKAHQDFVTCPRCSRVYWQGTHWGNVMSTLQELGN